MQVNLNLDMERMLPNFIKRRYIIKEEEVFPNAPKSVLNTYMLSDNDTLQRIVDEVVAKQTDVSIFDNCVNCVCSFLFTFCLCPGCLLCRLLGWIEGT